MNLKVIRNLFITLSVIVIVFGTGYRAGQKGIGSGPLNSAGILSGNPVADRADLTLFWDVWDRLHKYYVDKNALNNTKLINGAISGMVSSLGDPYTVFLPPEQNKEVKDDLGGLFEGIGAQLGVEDKKIVVMSPLKDSPAQKAGIKAGDWIVKVDGTDTSSWTLYEAVSKIRGPKGTSINLTVIHKNTTTPETIKVVRDTITVSSVDWELKNARCSGGDSFSCEVVQSACQDCKKIVYLRLSRFGDDTSEQWNKAVDQILEKEKTENPAGIVFDLRDNPGGYLSGSVFIASEFLPDGTVVIQDSVRTGRQVYTVDRAGRLLTIPVVVLINKGTASAAEIVAGSLKERGRAKLVGDTSFGKGSVQEAQDLAGGAGIHITTAKWLLPSGTWINGKGIDPDVKIENSDSSPENDLQLTKGIEVLLSTRK